MATYAVHQHRDFIYKWNFFRFSNDASTFSDCRNSTASSVIYPFRCNEKRKRLLMVLQIVGGARIAAIRFYL